LQGGEAERTAEEVQPFFGAKVKRLWAGPGYGDQIHKEGFVSEGRRRIIGGGERKRIRRKESVPGPRNPAFFKQRGTKKGKAGALDQWLKVGCCPLRKSLRRYQACHI